MRLIRWLVLLSVGIWAYAATAQSALPLDQIELPDGFEIDIYSSGVPNARSLAVGDQGTVFVGSRGAGNVYALTDRDGDARAETVRVIAQGLDSPNGVAFRDGSLYVAELGRILRFDDIEARLDNPPQPVVVYDDFPPERHHAWKYLGFGPDGLLYAPVGVPCDICVPDDEHGLLMRIHPDGSGAEVYARGIRNTVGFDWHPETGELWFTDNARDQLGRDVPPDELNYAPVPGMHFGFPYCYGENVPDPDFGGPDCARFTPPALPLPAHAAPLGAQFYTGEMFPAAYHNRLFIAEHGGATTGVMNGFRVTMVEIEDGEAISYEPFAEGWLQGNQFWGRPVDLLVMPDGALLVSDDASGTIYRISYTGA